MTMRFNEMSLHCPLQDLQNDRAERSTIGAIIARIRPVDGGV